LHDAYLLSHQRIEHTTNLYVAINEELIATLVAPGPIGNVRVWLGLPVWLSWFRVVPDKNEVIHFAALPYFRTSDVWHCEKKQTIKYN